LRISLSGGWRLCHLPSCARVGCHGRDKDFHSDPISSCSDDDVLIELYVLPNAEQAAGNSGESPLLPAESPHLLGL
jgi:hypothetical protein